MSPTVEVHLSELRELRDQQERLSRFCYLPRLDDLELVQRTLPLASVAPLPVKKNALPPERDERGRLLGQRAEAYFVVNYGSFFTAASTAA